MVLAGPFEFQLQISSDFEVVFLVCLLDLGRGEQVGLVFSPDEVVYDDSADLIIEHLFL